ncbi:MAG: hypothetical protein JWO77_2769 [Ilumatobacteraceae bacterium]|nr:hypothetical protein [Ilumatobacteraceae bacterium]
MGPIGHQRIAQRFSVATTPIEWVVPKRRGLDARSKAFRTEAAIIEVSVMGIAIVCPVAWRAVTGTKVKVHWEDQTGLVYIRREVPFRGSTKLALYGAEFADNPSELGRALFERLVAEPAAADTRHAAAAAAEAVVGGYQAPPTADPDAVRTPHRPALWAAPVTWAPEAERR